MSGKRLDIRAEVATIRAAGKWYSVKYFRRAANAWNAVTGSIHA